MTPGTFIRRSFMAAVLCVAWPALAGNYSYLYDIPYTHFTEEDKKIFFAALDDVLEKGADGEARTWSNPNSRASGNLQPLKSFERKGLKCRRLLMENKARGRSASGEYNFCKKESGQWTFAN